MFFMQQGIHPQANIAAKTKYVLVPSVQYLFMLATLKMHNVF